MAHFAELDGSNKVLRVVVVNDVYEADGENWCNEFFHGGTWKQTSYNTHKGVHLLGGTPLRKNYAGPGYSYDETRDAFIAPQPYPSWSLNEGTCIWEPPVPHPTDDTKVWEWDEASQNWVEVV